MLERLRQELNQEQFEAVTTTEGPLLIIAGAGSGKTRVITYRIAHMLDKGIPQSQILALTFTNKAAKEMEERVKEKTGRKLQNLTVSTFHAFGVKVLRQDIERLGWRSNFSIYDETDRNQLIKETGRELGFTTDALDVYAVGNLFSNIKTGRWTWDDPNPKMRGNSQYQQLYQEYQRGLQLYNAVDFDDLITLPIRLFREHPDVLEQYRSRYKYIMVDEFQDTSIQQYQMMHLLADRNVAVVGDDDQSIYSWRGANYENIRMFERDFPDVREIRLEQNYRSTETILAAANGVISHNTNRKDKALWSGNGSGRPIEIFLPENEAAEADFIAEAIQGICMSERRSYDDFGVLMRANTQSRAIEEAFLAANIPYTISGGSSFFQRKEIKDVISYLRVCANHDDDINLLRILNTPRRGIGRKTLETLNQLAREHSCSLWQAIQKTLQLEGIHSQADAHHELQPVESNDLQPAGANDFQLLDDGGMAEEHSGLGIARSTLVELASFVELISRWRGILLSGHGLAKKVRDMVQEINYWDYLISEYQKNEKAARFKFLNIESLLQSLESWENGEAANGGDASLFSYLNRITLLSRDDMEDDTLKGKVNLMTIHASKGLEFPVVFIAGAEDGIIPHARSIEESEENIEEERRLFYVAITRAQHKLYISACRRRKKMQSVVEAEPSRFLDEIPPELVEYHEPATAVDTETALSMMAAMKSMFQRK
ncbi:MAG: UvrD-helicase domain-containing protein [Spirochaetaceae bacterium]|nr:UvrD-helicase domain-containing protein [Spirochaetaceae bacterium]